MAYAILINTPSYRLSKWHYRQRQIIFEFMLLFIADTDRTLIHVLNPSKSLLAKISPPLKQPTHYPKDPAVLKILRRGMLPCLVLNGLKLCKSVSRSDLVLELTIPWTFSAGSFLSLLQACISESFLRRFKQKWRTSVFALFA